MSGSYIDEAGKLPQQTIKLSVILISILILLTPWFVAQVKGTDIYVEFKIMQMSLINVQSIRNNLYVEISANNETLLGNFINKELRKFYSIESQTDPWLYDFEIGGSTLYDKLVYNITKLLDPEGEYNPYVMIYPSLIIIVDSDPIVRENIEANLGEIAYRYALAINYLNRFIDGGVTGMDVDRVRVLFILSPIDPYTHRLDANYIIDRFNSLGIGGPDDMYNRYGFWFGWIGNENFLGVYNIKVYQSCNIPGSISYNYSSIEDLIPKIETFLNELVGNKTFIVYISRSCVISDGLQDLNSPSSKPQNSYGYIETKYKVSLHLVDELNTNYNLPVDNVNQIQSSENNNYETDKETDFENKKTWLDTPLLIFGLLIFVAVLAGIAVGRKR